MFYKPTSLYKHIWWDPILSFIVRCWCKRTFSSWESQLVHFVYISQVAYWYLNMRILPWQVTQKQTVCTSFRTFTHTNKIKITFSFFFFDFVVFVLCSFSLYSLNWIQKKNRPFVVLIWWTCLSLQVIQAV